jgi:hypothetical protein
VPIAPLVTRVPLAVAAMSYAGELAVSVDADAAVPDLDALAVGAARAFADLEELARAGGRLPSLPGSLVGHGRGVVEAAVRIDRGADRVFAYSSDPCSEPEWNPQVAEVEKLTGGPIGVGSRYRMRFRSGVGNSLVEVVAFDAPRTWASRSSAARLDVRFQGDVVPDAGGCCLRFRAAVRPRGVLRLLAPVLRRVLRRRLQQDLSTLRTLHEDERTDGVPVPAAAPTSPGSSAGRHGRSRPSGHGRGRARSGAASR